LIQSIALTVTLQASGIGLALSKKCVEHGMKVIMVDNNSANLAAAKSTIKGNVTTVEMDVSKIEDFEKLKGRVIKGFGGQSTHSIARPFS